jgi:hypothetical protein
MFASQITHISFVIDAQLSLCPAHTHKIYSAYGREGFVININIIGVVTVKVLDRRSWVLYEW